MTLKKTFISLLSKYSANNNLNNRLWMEIEINYSGKNRYYHTLNHLRNLLLQVHEVRRKIQHWESLLLTLFYHDIIYNTTKTNNEEKSAELAEKRMKQVSIPLGIIERCKKQIIATKSHTTSTDSDTNYFLDADLSILGQDWRTYSTYYKNVRKEFSFYPSLLYKPGRKKVLLHFLEMDRIFKTDYFYHKFETTAKLNLEKELSLL